MKPILRIHLLFILSLVIPAATETNPAAGLTVHEWGTFTSVAADDGSPLEWNTLGCTSDLPRFVKDFGFRGWKARLQGTVRMETPVLYFYSPRELTARVKVEFRQGLITEWYPQAAITVDQKSRLDGSMQRLPANLNGLDTSLETLTGALEWRHQGAAQLRARVPHRGQPQPLLCGPRH